MNTLLFLLLATLPCFARLGETEAQCIARYGTPVLVLGDYGRAKTECFSKNNFSITITFLDGKSVYELYEHPQGANGEVCGVTEEEAKDLLADNADGGEWKQTEPGYMVEPIWKRKGATSMLDSGSNGERFSIIADGVWQQAEAIIDAAKAKKTTDGL